MTVKLAHRIAALENKAKPKASALAGLWLSRNPETGGVAMCWDIPRNRVIQGLAEFYTPEVWRDRATCPDASSCEHFDICEAKGLTTTGKEMKS
jgi:hypothetical protein